MLSSLEGLALEVPLEASLELHVVGSWAQALPSEVSSASPLAASSVPLWTSWGRPQLLRTECACGQTAHVRPRLLAPMWPKAWAQPGLESMLTLPS